MIRKGLIYHYPLPSAQSKHKWSCSSCTGLEIHTQTEEGAEGVEEEKKTRVGKEVNVRQSAGGLIACVLDSYDPCNHILLFH